MNRAIIAAVLIFSMACTAQADNDTYADNTKQGRGNDALDASVNSCAQIYGMPQNGTPTSRQFNRCMLGYGWRFLYTTRSPKTRQAPVQDDYDWSFDGCTFNPASSSSC